MRFFTLGLALLLAPSAFAQETQDVRLRVVSNDAAAGGTITIAIDARTSADRSPANSLGSATIDIAYDADHLTLATFSDIDQSGYSFAIDPITCSGLGGTCYRIGLTTSNIGTAPGKRPGFNVGTAFTELATIGFTLDATSAEATTFVIDRSTLSIGYYDSENNANGNTNIEDNTGTKGDGTFPLETVRDLSVRTATFDAGPNWYLAGLPGADASLDALVGPLWTQGFPGSDAGTNGTANVAFWSETLGGYVAPTEQSDVLPPGAGLFLYAYADDDADGTDEPFPKTATLAASPVNDQGAPVNKDLPNVYIPTLPFDFSVTYTASSGAAEGDGWNLLSNPTDGTADWDASGWTRTNTSAALYTWDPDAIGGAKYVTWTAGGVGGDRGDGELAPFEGFWAKAMSASPVLTMPAAAYAPFVPAALRDASSIPTVRLRVSGDVAGETLSDDAFVAFLDGADAGLDALDAYELSGLAATQLHLFSQLDSGDRFTTDVRPVPGKDGTEIPLDVTTVGAASELTLTWPELRSLDAGTPVQLLDRETRTIVDLWAESSYTFKLATTAGRTADTKAEAVPALRGPTMLGGSEASRESARRADASRFTLFVGTAAVMPVSADGEEGATFDLFAPAPNPARGTTRLRYALETASEARVAVYDMLGRIVTVAAAGPHAAGPHDARVDTGTLAPGLYVIRLEAGDRSATQSLTVVR